MAAALGSPEGWPPRRYGGTVADCVPHRRGEVKKNGKAGGVLNQRVVSYGIKNPSWVLWEERRFRCASLPPKAD